jgi:hypothetical protein
MNKYFRDKVDPLTNVPSKLPGCSSKKLPNLTLPTSLLDTPSNPIFEGTVFEGTYNVQSMECNFEGTLVEGSTYPDIFIQIQNSISNLNFKIQSQI